MIESVYNCWERFKSGEIEIGQLIEQLDDIQETCPAGLVVALVQHLEGAFERGDFAQEKLISILAKCPTQSEAKITSYTKCLRSLIEAKCENILLTNQLFDLVESLVDPKNNWSEAEPKNDSNCRLLGSVDSLISLSTELINQKYDHCELYQFRGIQMLGVLLSSNQHAHNLVLTETIYSHILAQLRAGFNRDEDQLKVICKVIVRFIHQLHHTKGIPPFPLEACIQPLISIVTAEYELANKLKVIDLLAECLRKGYTSFTIGNFLSGNFVNF